MSQRVKKSGKQEDNQGKRRRRRLSASDGEDDGRTSGNNSGGNGGSLFPSSVSGMWTPRHLNDLKVSSIYNRNSAEAPAELYRKDLISAMKLADSEPLTPEEYWLITDPWKQEWEKGVQVPVNPESLPEPEVVVISPVNERSHDFRLPKKKYIRVTHDDFFNPDYHQLVSTAARAEKVCSYDLDDVDAAWLSCANADRGMQSLPVISEFLMEQVIEELELQCWEQVQTILKSQEGLGIEYDENVICDVCRSPESEEGNEMVFCDSCNICVHQACYGITTIPSGSWLCRTCTLEIRPSCVLCPNMGGAMKATRSGQKWAHVACAIWIPEVSIGSVEKMEPITKISAIPQSRWSLVCVICKDKVGACIQCSVKTCKTAYHVTCAFKNGLEMKPIIVDENAEDGIKLRSYCEKHSVHTKKDKPVNPAPEDEPEKKSVKAMTAEERNQARAEKLQQIEAEFYKYVRLKDVSQNLAVDMDIVLLVFNYWKLKRRSFNNRPLVPPRPETTQLLTQQQEQDLEQMKMFVQLRQDLERVRNLCYMVSRREKLSRTYFKLREQTFQKQVALLGEKDATTLRSEEKSAILEANHGPSIYDQIYSHGKATSTVKDYENLVSLIAGDDIKDKDNVINGVIKSKKSARGLSSGNSFKKQYVNGARKKNLMSESCSSLSESEISVSDNPPPPKTKKHKVNQSGNAMRNPLSYLFESDSSASAASASSLKNAKKKKRDTKKISVASKEGQGKSSTSDSEDLELPLSRGQGVAQAGKLVGSIYSDSESDANQRPASPVTTKAAVKEFVKKSNKKGNQNNGANAAARGRVTTTAKPKGSGRKKKAKPFEATELIVPQREAAKKATENIRSVKPKRDQSNETNADSVSARPSSPVNKQLDKDSEAFEKATIEKFKDIAAASFQMKNLKKADKKVDPKAGRKAIKNVEVTQEDLLEYDGIDDGSKAVPSFVPQRQAAKKAAEHIRSGLSNIVAARLIIEDEMEAARKKTKGGEKLPLTKKPGLDVPAVSVPSKKVAKDVNKALPKSPTEAIPRAPLENDSRSRARKRNFSKEGKTTKRKEASNASESSLKDRQADWPFLDRGSQSASRRSRERSSSTSSSSSSGSSSSDSSSSSRSSASSSPASASPESHSTPKKTTLNSPNRASSLTSSVSSARKCPAGRKLKSSDRSPDGGPSSKTPARKKPAPKSSRPGQLRPGGSSISSSRAVAAGSRPSLEAGSRPSSSSSSSCSSDSDDGSSPSPPKSSPGLSTKNHEPSKAKGKRGKGKPSKDAETEESYKSPKSTSAAIKPLSKSSARSETKALAGSLDLSSDSEPEVTKVSDAKPTSEIEKVHQNTKPLWESDTELLEEKENSCRTASVSGDHIGFESPTAKSRNQKPGSSAPAGLILSPLMPSENKEKDLHRCAESEPEAKRPRLDSEGCIQSQMVVNANPLSQSNIALPLLHPKPLYSPTKSGHEADLTDFDSELYAIAKSVSDYAPCDDDVANSGNQLLAFPQSVLCREETEDSAQATLNLVEKLRLQHARKSGCPRSSVDGSDDISLSEDNMKSPRSNSRLSDRGHDLNESSAVEISLGTVAGTQPIIVSSSPSRKALQEDERWVPPNQEPVTLHIEESHRLSKPILTSPRDISSTSSQSNVGKPKQSNDLEFLSPRTPRQEPMLHKEDNSFADKKLLEEPAAERILSDSAKSPSVCPSPTKKTPQTLLYPNPSNSNYQAPNSHSPFLYPIAGAPSLQNLVSSLTVNVGSNSPQSQHLRNQQQIIPPGNNEMNQHGSQNSPSTSLSPGFPRQSFGGAQAFLPNSKENVVTTPTVSPGVLRRSSDLLEDKRIPDPISSVVPPSMMPLAKPAIASPSMILAANNVKNITPPPPPQSTVAQIIENVVNNHANSSNLAAQDLLSVLSMAQFSSEPTENKAKVSNLDKYNNDLPHIPEKLAPNSTPIPDVDLMKPIPSPIKQTSPRGRGRRGAGGRSSARIDKVLTTSETNTVAKGKGRGERKTSPVRGKAASGRRGGGRGRGRGKNMIATRKDLAGTVYDIDFDEFEENLDEKLDLRMLRERRKSSDIHSEIKSLKHDTSKSPNEIISEFKSSKVEVSRSPAPENTRYHGAQKSFPSEVSSENIAPILQPPLPGPVDMRTYSGCPIAPGEVSEDSRPASDLQTRRDSTNMFESPAEKTALLEIEEFDETLEALTKSAKSSSYTLNSADAGKLNSGMVGNEGNLPNITSKEFKDEALSIGSDPISVITDPLPSSRNQLKVKIKGPFLDANYGSHTMVDPSAGGPHYPNSFYPAAASQMVNVPASNTSNLRRMRKKELLRQYWNQDMNMDGSSNLNHDSDLNGISGSVTHPINRAVITIPKAVASMAIIPTKDDYRETFPPSNNTVGANAVGKDSGNPTAAEKRKRSRGIREMAALGILTTDNPRERRRERAAEANLSSVGLASEMGKKRGRTNKRPVRSTFIPPTLVESDSTAEKNAIPQKDSSGSNAVVTSIDHPTPKLKIKFADLAKASGSTTSLPASTNHVFSDSSDKEGTSKKVKGRPPKKRGISELAANAPPSMEELKRQSMKFREMVMQDFAVEERKEILQLHGTRRHKKHKRKGGAVSSETDDGAKSNTEPEVKVITDGSKKLILRFGKGRANNPGATDSGASAAGSDKLVKEEPGKPPVEDAGENDSGFTGSSEGSSGSASDLSGSNKVAPAVVASSTATVKVEESSCEAEKGSKSGSNQQASSLPLHELSNDLTPNVTDVKPSLGNNEFAPHNDKIPIRLKLSRCFEGYALKNKQDGCVDGVPSTPAKQSDSCEVR